MTSILRIVIDGLSSRDCLHRVRIINIEVSFMLVNVKEEEKA